MAPRQGRSLRHLGLGHRLFRRCNKNDHSGQPSRESGICDVCDACLQGTAEILKDERPGWPSINYRHHTSLESFASSVSSSCPFCLGLWNRYLQRPVKSALSPDFECEWSAAIDVERETLGAFNSAFTILGRPDLVLSDGSVEISLSMELGNGSSGVAFVLYTNPSSSLPIHTTTTGAPEALQIVEGWLTTCQKDHPRCSISDRWYPSRLLHIVRHDKLRLVHTATYSVSGPYCTLSYCWGTPSKAPVLLTAESMSSLTSGIDVEGLPRTFRDAVKVCIELGVYYLWIDSLCIIQNDRADWERESRSMHKVYSHGCCNLSATASEDSDGGLFRTRPYDHDYRTRVDVHRADDFIAPGKYIMIGVRHGVEELDTTPLQTRAWAFQERVLSPRNIHFGPTELIWECNTLMALEHGGLTWNLGELMSPFTGSIVKPTAHERVLIDETSDSVRSKLLDHWRDIQQSYSGRRLTYSSDREIALGGVVSALESEYNQICTFGLWENYLLAGLVWESLFRRRPVSNHWPKDGPLDNSERYAWIPSFSWLAADAAIQSSGSLDLGYCCEMVHHELRNVANVPEFRPHVLLCGHLRQVTIIDSSSERSKVDVKLEGRHDGVFYAIRLDRTGQVFDILFKPKGSLFCLPLANREGTIVCMLLQIKGQSSTTYSRIGSCKIVRRELEIFELRQENEAVFPCESYNPETGKHVIRIE